MTEQTDAGTRAQEIFAAIDAGLAKLPSDMVGEVTIPDQTWAVLKAGFDQREEWQSIAMGREVEIRELHVLLAQREEELREARALLIAWIDGQVPGTATYDAAHLDALRLLMGQAKKLHPELGSHPTWAMCRAALADKP